MMKISNGVSLAALVMMAPSLLCPSLALAQAVSGGTIATTNGTLAVGINSYAGATSASGGASTAVGVYAAGTADHQFVIHHGVAEFDIHPIPCVASRI